MLDGELDEREPRSRAPRLPPRAGTSSRLRRAGARARAARASPRRWQAAPARTRVAGGRHLRPARRAAGRRAPGAVRGTCGLLVTTRTQRAGFLHGPRCPAEPSQNGPGLFAAAGRERTSPRSVPQSTTRPPSIHVVRSVRTIEEVGVPAHRRRERGHNSVPDQGPREGLRRHRAQAVAPPVEHRPGRRGNGPARRARWASAKGPATGDSRRSGAPTRRARCVSGAWRGSTRGCRRTRAPRRCRTPPRRPAIGRRSTSCPRSAPFLPAAARAREQPPRRTVRKQSPKFAISCSPTSAQNFAMYVAQPSPEARRSAADQAWLAVSPSLGAPGVADARGGGTSSRSLSLSPAHS